MNKVEDEYIRQYSIEYGDRLLNKKSVPKKTFKIHEYIYQAQIETEQQLQKRLRQKFGDKIKIKDDLMNKLPYYDNILMASPIKQWPVIINKQKKRL